MMPGGVEMHRQAQLSPRTMAMMVERVHHPLPPSFPVWLFRSGFSGLASTNATVTPGVVVGDALLRLQAPDSPNIAVIRWGKTDIDISKQP